MKVPINGEILLFHDLFEIASSLHSHIFKTPFLSSLKKNLDLNLQVNCQKF